MQDLTQGSITRHLLGMAAFIGMGLLFQTLYFVVDLYFVSKLGKEAIAGVSTAGTVFMLLMALTQLVGVGALALISQAAGRKDEVEADFVFNQSMALATIAGVLVVIVGTIFAAPVMKSFAADAETAHQGALYLYSFIPGMAIMFPMGAMGSGLRATGVVKPTMVLQTVSILLNVILAPILIAGWGTGVAMGVAGAGLATTLASVASFVALWFVFPMVQTYLRVRLNTWSPNWKLWGRLIMIGLPAAGEFVLMFITSTIIYVVIRSFGAAAQAGFGIGFRVSQSIFLPAMAVAFAAAPIAGQNYGARNYARVRQTFATASMIGSVIMAVLTGLCLLRPDLLVSFFTTDPAVSDVAVGYLRIASFNFVALGIVFCCSGIFQALGNTLPSFLSSATRLVTFAIPALWLSSRGGATLQEFWFISAGAITLQAVLSFLLLRREFSIKFKTGPAETPPVIGAAPV